jgi:hypothetical protein
MPAGQLPDWEVVLIFTRERYPVVYIATMPLCETYVPVGETNSTQRASRDNDPVVLRPQVDLIIIQNHLTEIGVECRLNWQSVGPDLT